MSYTIRFLPDVEEDIFSGYSWYEEKATGLGEEFLRVFYSFIEELNRNPLLYQKVSGNFRRCLMKRFPYSIYIRIEKNEITVFGAFHCARDPRIIYSELGDRSDLDRK